MATEESSLRIVVASPPRCASTKSSGPEVDVDEGVDLLPTAGPVRLNAALDAAAVERLGGRLQQVFPPRRLLAALRSSKLCAHAGRFPVALLAE